MTWVALVEESLDDYLEGHMAPLDVRETDAGVEVFMPHDFPERYEVHRICNRCNLLPMDYDAIEVECISDEDEEHA